MKRALSVLLALCMLAALCACGASEANVVPYVPEADSGEMAFYGVVESKGVYYVRVTAQDSGEAQRDVPLASDARAVFQQDGWEGAWSPEQYDSAKALAAADEEGKLTHGVRFVYSMSEGRMQVLEQFDPYEDINITTGEEE